jgi:dTDP-4-dehydrorhamnose reductase
LVGAYTNVDKAEDEAQKLCYNINVEGIQNFMENFLEWRKEGCGEDGDGENDCDGKGSESEGNIESESGDDSKSYNPVVIYISTDMVGSGDSALEEDENVWEPLVAVNEYGKSKALAEKLIKDMHEEYAHLFDYRILRICFPIASWRRGSIFTLLKKTVAKGKEVQLVEDEVQTLTYVPHTAYNSILMAKFGENGVYHDAMLGDDEGVGGNDKYGCSPFEMGNYFAELMGWDVALIGRMKHQDMYDKGWWSAPRGLSAELKVEKGLEIEGWKSGDMKEILDEYAEEMQD